MIDSDALADLAPVIKPVAERFVSAGFRLYLVGGIVRDLVLGRPSGFDIDLTTDARPKDIKRLVSPLADAVWSQGERFGTIGASVSGNDLEITTHRAESYDPESRKPVVSFGDDLREDLSRRDFTINAMAVELPNEALHDPFGGFDDLKRHLLRTPLSPEISFNDDPLRMLRAARFISRFDLAVDPEVAEAATRLSARLDIVSVERVADEIERLLAVTDPSAGLSFLRATEVLEHAIAPLDAEQAELACALAASPGEVLIRRAGLLWPVDAAAVLRRLRYSNRDRHDTLALLDGVRDWIDHDRSTPADGRRLVARAGADAPRALADNLVRHIGDPSLVEAVQRLHAVLDQLAADEDLGPYESPLSGAEIMNILGVEPGPVIGRAQKELDRRRIEEGPMSKDQAAELVRREFGGTGTAGE